VGCEVKIIVVAFEHGKQADNSIVETNIAQVLQCGKRRRDMIRIAHKMISMKRGGERGL
jgi:hypothetical protein